MISRTISRNQSRKNRKWAVDTLGGLSCLCFAGLLCAQGETPLPYTAPEAYEVYSAILPYEWAVSVAGAKRLVIREETTSYQMCLEPAAESARMVGPAIAHYAEVNQKPWSLQRNFHIDLPYLLAAAADLTNLFNIRGVDGWKEFYKRYPGSGGWIELSAIGFNDDKTVAVVYHGHHCDNLCGGGGLRVGIITTRFPG